MKLYLFLPFLLIIVSSCSDEEHLFGPASETVQSSELANIEANDGQLLTIDESSIGGDVGLNGTFDICVSNCYKVYKKEYDFLRTLETSCEALRTKKKKDITCTRRVFVRYEYVVPYPGEEEVRRAVYRTESYVCGQEETATVISLADESSAVRNRYLQCKTESREEFLTELEKLDYRYGACTRRCNKGPDEGGGIGTQK